MLKRIKIQGYKSLVDIDVKLEALSLLVGPNSAGKSNFLDALQLLSRISNSRTIKEAFQPPYRGSPLESFTFDTEGIRGLLSKESKIFCIEADIELSPTVIDKVNRQIQEMKRTNLSDNEVSKISKNEKLSFVKEKYLRYRIEIEILPKSGILRVADEYLTALNSNGEPTGKRSPFLNRKGDRLHLRMEGQAHPTYYERYLDHSILSKPLYPPHYPHLVATREELASWFFFYFEPRERMRASSPVKEVRHIGLMGEDLASFLNTLHTLDEKQFQGVEKSLKMIIPTATGIDLSVNDLGEVELRLFEGKTPIPARVLSEGTLRVLGLLALGGAKEQPALIGFEEPENGIHPRRIRMIADLLLTRATLGKTQLIITTHSPLLTDLIPNKFLYVCRKKDRDTQIESFSSFGEIFRQQEIESALDSEGESTKISERILRGDFDA